MNILVDSDVLIEVSRARDRQLLARWRALADSNDLVLCSPVTAAELWTGARPREEPSLTNLFQSLLSVPIDYEVGRKAGEYLRLYHKSHGLQLGDALIAATTVLNDALLWTRSRKHYPMKELSFY